MSRDVDNPMRRTRDHLVLYTKGGDVVRFRSLQNRRRQDERWSDLVERAAAAINRHIAELASGVT